jgi:hypothetical protein
MPITFWLTGRETEAVGLGEGAEGGSLPMIWRGPPLSRSTPKRSRLVSDRQAQPGCSSLKSINGAVLPLATGEQPVRLSSRHAECLADFGRGGDASLVEFPANGHT